MKLVQHGHYLKFSSMDESYFSELVSDEPNQIKARANTNDISNRFINQVDTYLYLVVKSRQENLIQVKPLNTPNLPPAD